MAVGDEPLLSLWLGAPGSAWPALPLPTEPLWLASAGFVLAGRLACRSQGEDELGTTTCLLPPRLRVSPESRHPAGDGGRDAVGLFWLGRGGEIRHLRAPSPACRRGRASPAGTVRLWPVGHGAHTEGDAAPPAPGSMCACQPGGVDTWAPSCAHPIPPAPTLGAPCPARRCWKRHAGFSPGRALCFSMPALKSLVVFYWRLANKSEGAASAACAVGQALAAGSRWDAGNRRTHLGATWEPASSHHQPCGNSSLPVLGRVAPGPGWGHRAGDSGQDEAVAWAWGGPGPAGSPGERWSGAVGGYRAVRGARLGSVCRVFR